MSTLKTYRIERDALNELIQKLRKERYTVIGPTPRGGGNRYLDEITTASELPVGKTDEQSPAQYHLKERADKAFFGFGRTALVEELHLSPPLSGSSQRTGLETASRSLTTRSLRNPKNGMRFSVSVPVTWAPSISRIKCSAAAPTRTLRTFG